MPKVLSIKSVSLAVLLVASINLVWIFYQVHLESVERQQAYEQHRVYVDSFGAYRDVFFRIYIEMSLFVNLVGVWIKGFKGTLISAVGLAGATLFYVLWWPLYFKLVALAISDPVELQFIRHTAYLYQANYLDILVAVLIGLLILLHMRSAFFPLFRPTKPCS